MKTDWHKVVATLCIVGMTFTMASCGNSQNSAQTLPSFNISQSGNDSSISNISQPESDFSSSDVSQQASDLTQLVVTSAQNGTIFIHNGEKYYCNGTGRVFHIVNDNTFELVYIDNASGDNFPLVSDRFTFNGNDFYGLLTDFGKIVHWSFTGTDMVKQKELYTTKNMKSVVQGVNLEKYNEDDWLYILSSLSYPQDGGNEYIYATINFDLETISEYYDLESKLVRMAKDGSKFDFINDVSASALTVCTDWLYYYDSGYISDEGKLNTFDTNRRGIYKMKLDGSERIKLTNSFSVSNFEKNINHFHAVSKMFVAGNQLYFMMLDNDYDYYLNRLDMNSGKIEKLSEKPCTCYYVDTSSNILYYAGLDNNFKGFFSVKNLFDGTEKELKTDYVVSGSLHRGNIQIDTNYLYISSNIYVTTTVETEGVIANKTDGTTVIVTEPEYQLYNGDNYNGVRININTGDVDYLYSYRKWNVVNNDFGSHAQYVEPLRTEWKSAEEVNKILKDIKAKYSLE